jgi:heptosyltransferase-1
MKFLIIKTSSLGDILQTYPVTRALRLKYPDAVIDWVVEKQNAELVFANPDIDKTYLIHTSSWKKGKQLGEFFSLRKTLKAENYDVIFDLQGNMKSGIFTYLARGKKKIGFGFKTAFEWPNALVTHIHIDPPRGCNVREEYLSLVDSYIQGIDRAVLSEAVPLKVSEEHQSICDTLLEPISGPKALVCPGSRWTNKQLPQETLTQWLKELEKKVKWTYLFAWGSPEEKEMCASLQQKFKGSLIVPRLPLQALQYLMRKVDLVISMDSLPLHLAATAGTPTLSVFGASSAEKYKPLGPQHVAIQGKCPYGRTIERRCPILRSCPTGLCIKGLSVKDLII